MQAFYYIMVLMIFLKVMVWLNEAFRALTKDDILQLYIYKIMILDHQMQGFFKLVLIYMSSIYDSWKNLQLFYQLE